MKKMTKTIALILAFCALLSVSAFATSELSPANITVTVRNDFYPSNAETNVVQWPDAKPFIDSTGRTMVPLRPIADAMGLDVKWDAATETAIFTGTFIGHPRVAYFEIGSDTIVIETYELDYSDKVTEYFKMDTTAVIVDGRTYAPARFLGETFDYYVKWKEDTRTVDIHWRRTNNSYWTLTLAHSYKETIDQILDFVDNRLDDYHAAIVAEYPYCDYDEDALAKMDANIAQLKACPSDVVGFWMYDYMYGFDELNGVEGIYFIESYIHTWLSCGGDGNQNITIQ